MPPTTCRHSSVAVALCVYGNYTFISQRHCQKSSGFHQNVHLWCVAQFITCSLLRRTMFNNARSIGSDMWMRPGSRSKLKKWRLSHQVVLQQHKVHKGGCEEPQAAFSGLCSLHWQGRTSQHWGLQETHAYRPAPAFRLTSSTRTQTDCHQNSTSPGWVYPLRLRENRRNINTPTKIFKPVDIQTGSLSN